MRLVADNLWTYIESGNPTMLDAATSYFKDGAWFSPQYKKQLWDGRVRFVKYDRRKGLYRFPTGLLSNVVKLLEEKQWRYSLEDNRDYDWVEPLDVLGDNKLGSIRIREYQQKAVVAALTHGRGIIKIATAGGKTVAGAAIIRSVGRRTVWFVHRLNLMRQTVATLTERLGQEVGYVGDSKSVIRDVTVSMVQTAANAIENDTNPEFLEFLKSCELLIGDECHHILSDKTGPNQQQLVAEYVPAPRRIGLSATPSLDGAGLALLALYGPVIIDIPARVLIEGGYIHQPHIWIYKIDEPIKFSDEETYATLYREGIVHNDQRNKAIAEILKRFKRESRKPLVLVDQISHAKNVIHECATRGVSTEFINGKVPEDTRERMIESLRLGHIDALVAITETMGEGTDIPFLDVVVNGIGKSGGGDAKKGISGRRTLQILGRILRKSPGKTRADYVDFADAHHKQLLEDSLDRVETLIQEGYSPYIKYWGDYGVHQ